MKAISVYGRAGVAALTAEQAASWDLEAREQQGIPERVLMENAGRAVAMVTDALFGSGRALALVGAGHNGGDALIALRMLAEAGREVSWICAGSRAPRAGRVEWNRVAHATH